MGVGGWGRGEFGRLGKLRCGEEKGVGVWAQCYKTCWFAIRIRVFVPVKLFQVSLTNILAGLAILSAFCPRQVGVLIYVNISILL